jgi:SAM-dependent methyltransferase
MQDRGAERAFYDRLFAQRPDNEHITSGYGELHTLAFPTAPDGPVLDLGCGTGTHAVRMARRGFRVVAVDLTNAGVTAARRRIKSEGLAGEFVVADAEQLPFRDGAFAVVWSALLLHHFPKLDRLPGELARVTRGRVVAFEPNAGNLLTWFAFNVVNRLVGLNSTTRNQRALWPGQLRRVFGGVGFRSGPVHYIHRAWTREGGLLHSVRRVYEWVSRMLPVSLRANKFLITFHRTDGQ